MVERPEAPDARRAPTARAIPIGLSRTPVITALHEIDGDDEVSSPIGRCRITVVIPSKRRISSGDADERRLNESSKSRDGRRDLGGGERFCETGPNRSAPGVPRVF
jgi:hypothetical protein